MIVIAGPLIAICVIWIIFGHDIPRSELIIKLSASAAATIILYLPFILVWKFFTIPEKLGQIVVGTGKSYATVEPSGANRTRIVRIMLKNNTCTEISRGKLLLLNLTPPNDGYKDFLFEDRLTIGPHKNIYIDIAAFNEGTSEAHIGSWIQLIIPNSSGYIMPATFGHLPVRSHKFRLVFSSLDEILDEVSCQIFVDSDHVLQLEEWSA